MLNFLNTRDISRVEELRADHHENQAGFAGNHRTDIRGNVTLPFWTSQQVFTGLVAGGDRADVGVIMGEEIDQLHLIETFGFHFGHLDDKGFRPEVKPTHAVRRIGIGGHNSLIFRRVNPGFTFEHIETALVFR